MTLSKKALLLIILSISLSHVVLAKELPIGLQRIIEHNNELVSSFALACLIKSKSSF